MSAEAKKSWALSPGGVPRAGVAIAIALLCSAAPAATAARRPARMTLERSPGCPKRHLPKRRALRCARSVPAPRPTPLAPSPPVTVAPPPLALEVAAPAPDPAPPASGEPPEEPVMTSVFAASSVWSQPAPTQIAPDSAELVAALVRKIGAEVDGGAGPRLGTDSRASLFRVGPTQPRVPVFLDTGPWGQRLAERFGEGVPIPPDAQPVSGSDHSMAVWQPATDSYWEFFKMQQALHAPQLARGPEVSGGCALAAGDYVYVVTSVDANGETSADAKGVGARVERDGGCVTIRWNPVDGATGYRVYRGLSGMPVSYLAGVPAGSPTFRDEGLALPDGTPPPATNTAATPGEWHAAYGGFMPGVSESPGYYRDRANPVGEVLEQSNWGSAATGLPLVGGLTTREDVERGSIDHAVSIGLDDSGGDAILRAGQFAFPAQRTDGRSTSPDSIPEGTRLVLEPELDLDSLELSPLARMLAEAAQKYGLIVEDGAPSTLIYAEDPAPGVRAGLPNFYAPLVGSGSPRALLSFPWQDLEVAETRLCTSAPCLPG